MASPQKTRPRTMAWSSCVVEAVSSDSGGMLGDGTRVKRARTARAGGTRRD
jgi:hypothetical protein